MVYAQRLAQIKGPDNPTSQHLPIIRKKWLKRHGERRTKEMVEARSFSVVFGELCVCQVARLTSCV